MKSFLLILTAFILNIVSAQESVTAAEYFIDTDPGVGSATAFTITNGNSVNSSFTVNTTGLTEGAHLLHVRVKDNLNQWSLYARKTFVIRPITTPNTKSIDAVEYFFDIDPGVGNATSVSITSGQTLNEVLNIDVPSDLPDGDHYLQIRVMDNNGKWSLYARLEFEDPLSISDFVLKNILLYPNPVLDRLYFSLHEITIEKATLIDINGKVIRVYSENLEHISMAYLDAGIYLLQLETNKGTISKKIIKK